MPKKDIHPELFENSQVFCDGQLIMTVPSTRPELHVDIWSGNHPFFTGSKKMLDTEGRVERFNKKYNINKN
jgi:large subunit ribosomal protein L31